MLMKNQYPKDPSREDMHVVIVGIFLNEVYKLGVSYVSLSQTFPIPSSWTAAGNLSNDDFTVILNRSQSAIDTLKPYFNLSTCTIGDLSFSHTADVFSAVALYDQISGGGPLYQDWVKSCFESVSVKTGFNFYALAPAKKANSDAIAWGLAAARAARAYSDEAPFFFNISDILWQQTNKYTVNITTTNLGCTSTLQGGISENPDTPDNPQVNANTTVGFAALSAYLFKQSIPRQTQYANAFRNATDYIYRNIYDNTSNIVLPSPCASIDTVVPSDSGLLIEALRVWRGNETHFNLSSLINGTISANWTGPDGTMLDSTESEQDDPTSKGRLISSLHEALGSMNQDIVNLTERFIKIQYHSVVSTVSVHAGINFYSHNWTLGSVATELELRGQLAAIDVMNSAASIKAGACQYPCTTKPTTSSLSSPGSSSTASASGVADSSHRLRNATVGGISAGAFALGLIVATVVAVLWCRRQTSRRRRDMITMSRTKTMYSPESGNSIRPQASQSQPDLLQSRYMVPLLPTHHSVPSSDTTDDTVTVSNLDSSMITDDVKQQNPFRRHSRSHVRSLSQPALVPSFIPSQPPNLSTSQPIFYSLNNTLPEATATESRPRNPFRKTLPEETTLISFDDSPFPFPNVSGSAVTTHIPNDLDGVDIGVSGASVNSSSVFGHAI
ncbi:hypothetical protein QCA50_011442 [Cerrena zonata]|uniref:Mannan endo-1,6-alpha-mannosidase n=1 Tax=Cerrena zonata TaxID=2478898 RepID=A0AAW0FWK8_9APHY